MTMGQCHNCERIIELARVTSPKEFERAAGLCAGCKAVADLEGAWSR